MAAISGTLGSVMYGGTAGTAVGLCSEWSLDMTNAVQTVPAFGQTWMQAITGVLSATGSFSVTSDTADAMQTQGMSDFTTGTAIELVLGAGVRTYIGTAFINSLGASISQEGKAEQVYGFTTQGDWTIA